MVTTTNPYTTAAGLLGDASTGLERFSGGLLQNINDYINPYYQNVVQNTLGTMQDQRTQALGQIGDAATAGGAFGGSRHGLVEAKAYSDFDKNMNEYVDSANAAAFTAGGNLYGQDLSGQLGLSTGLANLGNTYLGVGNAIQQQQAGYGQQQQDLMNQILQSQAGEWEAMTSSPYQIINMLQGAMASDPRLNSGMTSSSSTPGLFDYLSLGAQMLSGTNFAG